MSTPNRPRPRGTGGWWRRVDLNNAPAIIVLAVGAASMLYIGVASQHWLRGVGLLGVAMCLGGVFRAVLPARQAGLLAVRSRHFDAVCYLGLGLAILVVAILLRNVA